MLLGHAGGLGIGLSASPRVEVLVPLTLLGGLYVAGWWRLARRAPAPLPPSRVAAALTGFAALAVALLSPLDRAADTRFSAHMLQHILLMVVAAPALLLADPFPVVLWGLPDALRRRIARPLRRSGWLRRVGWVVTPMPLTWAAYASVLWLWHLPAAYDAALDDRLLHDLEHVTFFGAAVLFWWPVANPAPRVRAAAPYGARIAYVVLAAFQSGALGLALTFWPRVVYAAYAVAPPGPIDPLEDQSWGGILMWGVGSAIHVAAVLVLLLRLFSEGEARPVRRPQGATLACVGTPADSPATPLDR